MKSKRILLLLGMLMASFVIIRFGVASAQNIAVDDKNDMNINSHKVTTPNLVLTGRNELENHFNELGVEDDVTSAFLNFDISVEKAVKSNASTDEMQHIYDEFGNDLVFLQEGHTHEMKKPDLILAGRDELEKHFVDLGVDRETINAFLALDIAVEEAMANNASKSEVQQIYADFDSQLNTLKSNSDNSSSSHAWRYTGAWGINASCMIGAHATFYGTDSPYYARSYFRNYNGGYYVWYKYPNRWNHVDTWAGDWWYHFGASYSESTPFYGRWGYASCR